MIHIALHECCLLFGINLHVNKVYFIDLLTGFGPNADKFLCHSVYHLNGVTHVNMVNMNRNIVITVALHIHSRIMIM